MRPFPRFEQANLIEQLNTAAEAWEEHSAEFDDIRLRVGRVRKVTRVPTASNNVAATDREGDFNWDASYLYYLVNNSGTLEWRRIASASW